MVERRNNTEKKKECKRVVKCKIKIYNFVLKEQEKNKQNCVKRLSGNWVKESGLLNYFE